MDNHGNVTRINLKDPLSQAALRAEKALFTHFGLSYTVRNLPLKSFSLNVRILETGSGKPLLMVPGGSGDAVFFAPLIAELTGRRVIAINRPGGGLSDSVDFSRVDLRKLSIDTIRTVADAYGLDRADVVANSMGGLWALWYAQAHPGRVKRMVQIGCPALALDTSAPFFMRLLGVPGIRNLIAPNMVPKSVETANDGLKFQGSYQEDIDRVPHAGAEAVYSFFNLPTYLPTWKTLIAAVTTVSGSRSRYRFTAEEFRRIETPTQFIWGDNDPFGGLDTGREVVRLMPNARLHEMRAGHLPHIDKPEETGQVVQAFLDEGAETEMVLQAAPATV